MNGMPVLRDVVRYDDIVGGGGEEDAPRVVRDVVVHDYSIGGEPDEESVCVVRDVVLCDHSIGWRVEKEAFCAMREDVVSLDDGINRARETNTTTYVREYLIVRDGGAGGVVKQHTILVLREAIARNSSIDGGLEIDTIHTVGGNVVVHYDIICGVVKVNA